MESAELRALLSPESMALLNSLPSYSSSADVVSLVSSLRKQGHSPELVAAVLTQAKLRHKAASKFGEFARTMIFTEAGLEQATRLAVAAHHAGRYRRAGVTRVADLGCSIGADALAFAGAELSVLAVERDEVTAAIATYNLGAFPEVTVVHDDATTISLEGVDAVYLDPARRTSGHSETRRVSASDYSPSLDFAFGLATKLPTGIKLGPGFDREAIPAGCEAQWVSVDGDVVELGLWFGPLAQPGVTRSALVLGREGVHLMNAAADSENAPLGPLGRYLYEPDGAVIRARLIGDVARSLGGHMISESIAYISAEEAHSTPFAACFEVLEEFPLDIKTIAAELKQRGIGTLEIKKRGVDIDPAEFRTKLKLKGKQNATLILTRVGERRVALLAQRV